MSLKPRKEAVRSGEEWVVLADEHSHESACVEAHENKEEGGVNEGMRVSHELRKVNGIMGIFMKVTYRSEASYGKNTTRKVRSPHTTGQRLMARTE